MLRDLLWEHRWWNRQAPRRDRIWCAVRQAVVLAALGVGLTAGIAAASDDEGGTADIGIKVGCADLLRPPVDVETRFGGSDIGADWYLICALRNTETRSRWVSVVTSGNITADSETVEGVSLGTEADDCTVYVPTGAKAGPPPVQCANVQLPAAKPGVVSKFRTAVYVGLPELRRVSPSFPADSAFACTHALIDEHFKGWNVGCGFDFDDEAGTVDGHFYVRCDTRTLEAFDPGIWTCGTDGLVYGTPLPQAALVHIPLYCDAAVQGTFTLSVTAHSPVQRTDYNAAYSVTSDVCRVAKDTKRAAELNVANAVLDARIDGLEAELRSNCSEIKRLGHTPDSGRC
ncbi:MAG: hypothetical protein OXG52_09605 [bacterium]|nr:hypothetical protein [bacterium]